MRDVARHAGVSVATVSRVLNGTSNVSTNTRSRVEQAIETLRFVPSSAARAINSGRTRLVGALIPTLNHDIFARFVDALEDGLDAEGLSLIVASTQYDMAREHDRARKLLDIGVEGLIVSGTTHGPEFDALVHQYQVPVIATSLFDAGYAYPTIGYDNAGVAALALDHLLELGHREIAVLSGPTATNDRTRARLKGLAPPPGTNLHVTESEYDFASIAAATEHILTTYADATAILCLTDVLAHGVLTYLRSVGVDVPGTLSVISIDDLPNSKNFDPPLTTFRLPVGRMGATSAKAIARWIETDTVPEPVCIQTSFVPRASTSVPRSER